MEEKREMEREIPPFLMERLRDQYDEETLARILDGYRQRRPVTLRVNRLKTEPEAVKECLDREGMGFRTVPWSEDALIVEEAREGALRQLPLYEKGEIYLQSLSSMIPPLVLAPEAGESILDMAAAPGGKTTQIAALTGNGASITACEKNRVRADRLQYNLDRQGASRVLVMLADARKLDDLFSFDRILLDAPCSGSGTITMAEESRSKNRFTRELLNQSSRLQEELLAKALRLLKPGHEMVYSTCSILEEENERVLRRVLGKKAEIVPIDGEMFPDLPLLPVGIPGTLGICPDGLYEGFFVARIRRKG